MTTTSSNNNNVNIGNNGDKITTLTITARIVKVRRIHMQLYNYKNTVKFELLLDKFKSFPTTILFV